jgi:hypothetical protein
MLGDDYSLANDTIRGGRKIAAFIGEDPRHIFGILQRGLLPAGKLGAEWVASKRVLTEYFAKLTSGR